MNNEEMISKKELLQLTGISYGQLYRWKRQKLIPDSWFVKQSAFTGQETFLPKDKILKRIETIIKLKDQYSLDELAKLFSQGNTNRVYSVDDLKESLGVPQNILSEFVEVANKNTFTFFEVIFIHITISLTKKAAFENSMDNWIRTIMYWSTTNKNIEKQVLVAKKAGMVFFLLINQDGKIQLDKDTEELCLFNLSEEAKAINIKMEG